MLGKDAFQEADIFGITMPVVKHSYLVKETERHPADRPRGLPHRHHRPPGPGADRHAEGRQFQGLSPATCDPEMDLPGLPPRTRSSMDADAIKAIAEALNRVAAAGASWPATARMISGAGDALRAARRDAAAPGDHHPARQGRLPGNAPAVARHARHARHRLRQQGDGRVRPDHVHRLALRRPHHRPGGQVLRATRCASTSTSTRPRWTR